MNLRNFIVLLSQKSVETTTDVKLKQWILQDFKKNNVNILIHAVAPSFLSCFTVVLVVFVLLFLNYCAEFQGSSVGKGLRGGLQMCAQMTKQVIR